MHDPEDEKTLKDTVDAALLQIEKNSMKQNLLIGGFRQKESESTDSHSKERKY